MSPLLSQPTTSTMLMRSMRDYLASFGLCRAPSAAGDSRGNPPPMWLDPIDGVPAPGETTGRKATEVGKDCVLAAFKTAGIPQLPYEGFIRVDHVIIWIRVNANDTPRAYDLEAQIRNVLSDQRNYDMSGLLINQSNLFRDLSLVGADKEGYSYNMEYSFEQWSD